MLNIKNKKWAIILLLMPFLLVVSCKKFLEETPDKRLAVIATLDDLKALLNNYLSMNYYDVATGEVSSDAYFITDVNLATRSEFENNMYVWARSNIYANSGNDWFYTYKQVYTANQVLENAELIKNKIKDQAGLEEVRGEALFFRGRTYLNAVNVWAVAYDPATAEKDLGIPIRENTDFNIPSVRPSIKATYEQIISDLTAAAQKLPVNSIHPIRPSKAAAYGTLARAYLCMGNYDKTLEYADAALKIKSDLLDFNTLNASAAYPIGLLSTEVIFESRLSSPGQLAPARSFITPELYSLYDSDDLRKVIYFKASGTNWVFKGNYAAANVFFSGITVNELLLMRAECYARKNETAKAMADLNLLLKNRIKAAAFVPKTAASPAEALKLIKLERRKELLYRGLRWIDIKRFNKEGDNIVLTRTVNGKTYTLTPNSPNYAIPIPDDVIALSGMQQN